MKGKRTVAESDRLICMSKYSFTSCNEAALAVQKIHKRCKRKVFFYRCDNCRKWHLTSDEKSRRRRKARMKP